MNGVGVRLSIPNQAPTCWLRPSNTGKMKRLGEAKDSATCVS